MFKRKDLTGLKDVSKDEILDIFKKAGDMLKCINQGTEAPKTLGGRTVATLFYENSTRTKVSFETAAKKLGANVVSMAASASSVQKGETLIDTGRNLMATGVDTIIIRTPYSGAPELLAKNVKASVINGGDGTNEHPTQALLDIFTMLNHFSSLEGLKVVIAGDIKYSRVARSNIWALNKFGADVTVVGPGTLLPAGIEDMGVTVASNIESALSGANVVMGLRIQLERQKGGLFPSLSEYSKFFTINKKRLSLADSNALIMHPGPVNPGVEMSGEVMNDDNSVILEQVTNGVALRMAVLSLLAHQ